VNMRGTLLENKYRAKNRKDGIIAFKIKRVRYGRGNRERAVGVQEPLRKKTFTLGLIRSCVSLALTDRLRVNREEPRTLHHLSQTGSSEYAKTEAPQAWKGYENRETLKKGKGIKGIL